MCYFIRTSNSRYKKRLLKNAEVLNKKKEQLQYHKPNSYHIKKKKVTVHGKAKLLTESVKVKAIKASKKVGKGERVIEKIKLKASSAATITKASSAATITKASSAATITKASSAATITTEIDFRINELQPDVPTFVGSKCKISLNESPVLPKKKQMKMSSFFTSK